MLRFDGDDLYFMDANVSAFHLNGRDGHARWRKPMLQRTPEWLAAGIAALFLATGIAHADPVYDDDWDWSGCKENNTPYVTTEGERIDEAYYSCENGRDFEFFKQGNKRGYRRGGRVCIIKTFKELPGADSPRLVWASCKEGGVQQQEVLKMYSCCGVLMIRRVKVYPELTQ
jgi:hypothetical protein